MRTLLSIASYAGSTAFLTAGVLAGAFVVAMSWLGGDPNSRGILSIIIQWLLVYAMFAALIIFVSSQLLQRQEGILGLRSAAGAAAVMGLLTGTFFLGIAAQQESLNRGVVIFQLVGGSALGFVLWLAVFALFPRFQALIGVWR